MAQVYGFLRCVAEAVCAKGLRGLLCEVPFGELVLDVAGDAWQRLRRQRQEAEVRAEIQAVAQAGAEEVRATALALAREVAGGQPPEVQERLALYLGQVPGAVRQSLRRPSDPTGATVPPSLRLAGAEALVPMLPAQLPRFRPGDRPPGLPDWELQELLGTGGFGEVWKARHASYDGIAPAALKFCLDVESRDRLLRHEAAVLNQVMRQGKHPGIVSLLDAQLSADPPCLKYEYVDGGDLGGLLQDWQGSAAGVRPDAVARVILQLAATVGHMHRLSPPVVHRDLKPANVLVQRKGKAVTLKVADFGIGGVAAGQALAQTRLGGSTRRAAHHLAARGAHSAVRQPAAGEG